MRHPTTRALRRSLATAGVLVAVSALAPAAASGQASLASPFDTSYALTDIGSPPGVPARLGGLTFKAGATDRLLIGGDANESSGALWEVGVTRDASGHVNGFTGTATRFADAAFNDGGVTYGPGGVLFLARWDTILGGNGNRLGQTKPGSTITDKVIDLGPLGVAHSPGSVTFVPSGQPGAGSLKMASYPNGQWYDADLAPDAAGTYDLQNLTQVSGATLPGGPEGFVYVNSGSAQFAAPSLLVSEFDNEEVAAYEVDANGDPVVATRRTFITGLTGAEGAAIDPLTGDFLFSTFELGPGKVIVVRGFAAPPGTLRVVKQVVNDNGGGKGPGDFSLHVKVGGADVPGSPQPGSTSGSEYTLPPNVYTVSEDAAAGYDASFGGDCDGSGQVSLGPGETKTCTITNNDAPPSGTGAGGGGTGGDGTEVVFTSTEPPPSDQLGNTVIGYWRLRGSTTSAIFRVTKVTLIGGQLPPPIWDWTPDKLGRVFRPGGCYRRVNQLAWVIGFAGGGAWLRFQPGTNCRSSRPTTTRWFLNGPNGLRQNYIVDPDGISGPAPGTQVRLFWERTRPVLVIEDVSYNRRTRRLTVSFRTHAHHDHSIELRRGTRVLEREQVRNRDGRWTLRFAEPLRADVPHSVAVTARRALQPVREVLRFKVSEKGRVTDLRG